MKYRYYINKDEVNTYILKTNNCNKVVDVMPLWYGEKKWAGRFYNLKEETRSFRQYRDNFRQISEEEVILEVL